jgi:hypothetical protein
MTKKEIVKRQRKSRSVSRMQNMKPYWHDVQASLATWMRETCLSEKQTKQSRIVEVDPQLLRQLAGIGNNLNQIARIINQQSKTDTPLDRVAVITALSGIERELQRLNDDHKNP